MAAPRSSNGLAWLTLPFTGTFVATPDGKIRQWKQSQEPTWAPLKSKILFLQAITLILNTCSITWFIIKWRNFLQTIIWILTTCSITWFIIKQRTFLQAITQLFAAWNDMSEFHVNQCVYFMYLFFISLYSIT
jgi:hypothetical protein